MAWAKQQSSTVNGSGVVNDTNTLTPANNITAGNRWIVVLVAQAVGASAAFSVTDTAGNTWTEDVTHVFTSSIVRCSIWSTPISHGGGTKPTVTVSSSTDVYGISAVLLEVSGLSNAAGAAALDGTAGHDDGTGLVNNPTTGTTGATTAANELVVCGYGDYGWNVTMTAPTLVIDGNNSPNGNGTVVMGHKDSGATGTQLGTFAASGGGSAYSAVIAVYKLSTMATQVVTLTSMSNGGVAPANPTINAPQRLTLASFLSGGVASAPLGVSQRKDVFPAPLVSGSIFTPTVVQGLPPFPSVTSLLAGMAGELATAAIVFDATTNQAVALIGGNESSGMVYLKGVKPDGSTYLTAAIPSRTSTRPLYFFSNGPPLDVTSIQAGGITWTLTSQSPAEDPIIGPVVPPTLAPPVTQAIQITSFPITGAIFAPAIAAHLMSIQIASILVGGVAPAAPTIKQKTPITLTSFAVGGISPHPPAITQPSSGGTTSPTFLTPFAPWVPAHPNGALAGSMWYRPVARAIDGTGQVDGVAAFYGRGDGTTASPGITAPGALAQADFGGKAVSADYEYLIQGSPTGVANDLWSNPPWPSKNYGGFDTGKFMKVDGSIYVQASNGADLGVSAVNQAGAYLHTDGVTVYNFNAFCIDPAGSRPYASTVMPDTTLTGRGTFGGRGASSLSAFGGSLRPGELESASRPVPHAIKATAPLAWWGRADQGWHGRAPSGSFAGSAWPAQTSDDGSNNTGNGNSYYGASFPGGAAGQFWIGSLLAIKPTDLVAAKAACSTQAGKNLADVLCTYGMYIVENSATPWGDGPAAVGGNQSWQVWCLDVDYTAATTIATINTAGFNTDFCTLLPYLFVVMHNYPEV